ncbi:MAG: proP 1 [Candidatus Midichloriaceae bacterium]|jgi:MHS family proline/betaine transporter-like MFS transporter|nr:proP 1 [Candidatus Midichloriaceae bacterium]
MQSSKSNNVVKSIIASSVGNILEWYEYMIYAYFTSVIGALFFPLENKFIGILLAFATFAIGLAARPIGGVIFGYIGDKYSRKKMLTITMFLMSVPTLCIGLLPTYEQIGILAPILLVLFRMTQGIALGGEFGASCVYLYESVPQNKRGFYGSLALTGVGFGLILSSLTILTVESLATKEQVYSFAWRIPFFISVLGGIVAFYMRLNLLESLDFNKIKETEKLVSNPFFEMLKNHKVTLASLFGIFLTTQVAFFVVFVFGKTMMIDFLHFDTKTANIFSLITVISYTIATVVFGYLSDKINRKHIILVGVAIMLMSAHPFIMALASGNAVHILTMCILFGTLMGMTEGTLNPLVASSFPTNIRATSVAFCWNFTSIAFGGAAPIISMWLIDKAGSVEIVSYYFITVCAVTIATLLVSIFKKKTVALPLVKWSD